MVFTTQLFVFAFMPFCVTAYLAACGLEKTARPGRFLKRIRFKDIVLIIFSIGFYSWSCFADIFHMLPFIALVYLSGRGFAAAKDKGRQKKAGAFYAAAVALIVVDLACFKYTGFILGALGRIFRADIAVEAPSAPLGLSFIAFSAISYLTDIYKGESDTGDFIDCALYLSFFPKVVSGPIVLWRDFRGQADNRSCPLGQFAEGIDRIMAGFAKKALLADVFGKCLRDIGTGGVDRATATGTLILYMLQLYYDFSGYSDIAIGFSKLFGFNFKENFNFPYRSKSLSEFWRRWHISLGAWFREYVYFPLGGSRAGKARTAINLAVVFLLTGIWHGAGWNYILWGIMNGVIVITEHMVKDKPFYKKIPDIAKWAATMLAVMLLWQLFRFPSIKDALSLAGIIAGAVRPGRICYTWRYFFDAEIAICVIIGITGATLFGNDRVRGMYEKASLTGIGYFIREIALLALFALSIMFIVNSTYSPFIYFRF